MNPRIYCDDVKEGDEILMPDSATVRLPLRAVGR
jgi:hypothetical protein